MLNKRLDRVEGPTAAEQAGALPPSLGPLKNWTAEVAVAHAPDAPALLNKGSPEESVMLIFPSQVVV